MNCPTCKNSKLIISERNNIEIDYCPECRGVWLDRGELDKILERSRDFDPRDRPMQPEYQTSHQSGYSHKHYKRKKSFLEELFD